MSQTFTRAELYNLVWAEPLRILSKRIGVSDVAIAKRCRQAGIPLPGLGYWAKKEAGKRLVQAPLPKRGLGYSDEIAIGGRDRYGHGHGLSDEELIALTPPPPPQFEDDMEGVRQRAAELASNVRGTSLGRPHPAISKILSQEETRRQKFVETNWSWYAPIFDQPNEKRRLRVLNSLLNALSSLGYKCSAQAKDGYQFTVSAGDQHVHFSLAPKGYDAQRQYLGNPAPNNGKLVLQLLYGPEGDTATSWADDEGPLDKRLPEVVAGILIAAEWSYRERKERAHERLLESKERAIAEKKRREEEAVRRARERLEREAKARLEDLLSEVHNWRTASEIRAYVSAKLAVATNCEATRSWASWALGEACRLDPLKNKD